jgi:hypothetical protein
MPGYMPYIGNRTLSEQHLLYTVEFIVPVSAEWKVDTQCRQHHLIVRV